MEDLFVSLYEGKTEIVCVRIFNNLKSVNNNINILCSRKITPNSKWIIATDENTEVITEVIKLRPRICQLLGLKLQVKVKKD